ncbi:unnamed protein product [Musa hybrid cultivar]
MEPMNGIDKGRSHSIFLDVKLGRHHLIAILVCTLFPSVKSQSHILTSQQYTRRNDQLNQTSAGDESSPRTLMAASPCLLPPPPSLLFRFVSFACDDSTHENLLLSYRLF